MHDPQALGRQHHEGALTRRAREVRDQAGIAAEGNAGAVDRGLRMRGADDRVGFALAHEPHRRLDIADGRAACPRIERAGRVACRVERLGIDEGRRGVEPEPPGGVLDHEAVADQQRLDPRRAPELQRGLDRYLGPDAVGIAQGDRDSHGWGRATPWRS